MSRHNLRFVATLALAALIAPCARGEELPAGHPAIPAPPFAAPRGDADRAPPDRETRDRGAQERSSQERSQQERTGQERNRGDRPGRDRASQERPSQDSASHDSASQDRSQQDRSQQDRSQQDRGLPADVTTRHTLVLPDRALAFAATVGGVRLRDEAREPIADIAYAYYRLDGADPATRPIMFLFNGGPGSASAWLQLGAAGPWRIAMTGPNGEAPSPSAAPELLPNAETWLDSADLVFIDPVGTGWSRFVTRDEAARKRIYSVDGDARAVASAIRLILLKHERLVSPKFVVGESYGGVRGPKVAAALAKREGVGLRGLMLVSPVLDMRDFGGSSLLRHAMALPSMAAVARAAKGPTQRADLADVERYAAGEFVLDLLRGPADVAATDRLSARVAELIGLDPVETRRLNGRVSPTEFRRLFDRAHGRVLGRYDASVTGYDPFPDSSFFRFSDPSSDPLTAPMTSAITDLVTRRLGWKIQGLYRLLNDDVNHGWDWGRGVDPPESLTQIRELLAADPKLKLHVAHGLFDLATPYFASQLLLAQLPDFGRGRVTLGVHPGGHMFYSREAGRRALRAEAEAMVK